jgi:hypothetical protein
MRRVALPWVSSFYLTQLQRSCLGIIGLTLPGCSMIFANTGVTGQTFTL